MSHFGVPHTVNLAASGALRRNGKAAMSRIDRSKSRSASGMVVSIKSDELMGTTVVIEHAGGYTTQYSCLQAEPR